MTQKLSVLIVDDEKNLRSALKMGLEENYRVLEASSGSAALEKVLHENIDVVLLDIKLPDTDGITLLNKIKEADENIDVIMLTADNTVRSAVKSMQLGAYDYLVKPFDIQELNILITRALEKRLHTSETIQFKKQGYRESKKIIGNSKKIKDILQIIEDISQSDSTVLITGETGVGKELVARLIHQRSKRSSTPFVPVNCAAIPENLIESELFGHERGSFTGAVERHTGKFELACNGTIFLDEIGSLPLSLQAKLLRVLQDKKIERVGSEKLIQTDVRVVSATNSDLKKAIEEHKFREDLFYRLNVIPINVPPLRERIEDIEPLLEYFVKRFNSALSKKIKGFTKEAVDLLKIYHWPGNIRELENLTERMVVLCKEDQISADSLPFEISNRTGALKLKDLENLTLKQATIKFEKDLIHKAIEKAGGSRIKAAKLLGIHRNTLLQIEKKIDLQ